MRDREKPAKLGHRPGCPLLKSAFEEFSSTYTSGSQSARVKTERWVADWMYCINCGAPRLSQFPNNSPVADFFCPSCQDQFEVKSTKKAIGTRVADGAYFTKIERLQSATNPNLLLLGYDAAADAVRNVCIVPKRCFAGAHSWLISACVEWIIWIPKQTTKTPKMSGEQAVSRHNSREEAHRRMYVPQHIPRIA